MKETTFEVGQKVWSPAAGFATLEQIKYPDMATYPLSDGTYTYTRDGKFASYAKNRSLFTLEEAALLGMHPPKAKKTVTMYQAIYKDDYKKSYELSDGIFQNEVEAKRAWAKCFIALNTQYPITFEVEE